MSDDTILVSVPIPRSALVVVAPPPEMLSQKNAEAVAGIPAETYLRLLRSPDFTPRVMHEGKLRLVRRQAFLDWFEAHRAAPVRTMAPRDDVDALLVECGAETRRR